MRITTPLLALLLLPAVAQPQSVEWRQYASPAEAGFEADGLAAAKAIADSAGSAAVLAVYRGTVLVAWGDIDREYQMHSVRKSLVSALYGSAVARGEIDLETTLAALDVDDQPALTAAERRARLRDLIAARSGVYHGAAYAPSDQDDERPERGAHAPGDHWYYNNWDFNVAGVAYERLTREDLFASFERRIARPIGMQDYQPSDGLLVYEPTLSRHPAHTFRMSTRDLARFGQLYLQRGEWDGRRVLPESWIDESTAPTSDLGDGTGYGYMWWTYAAGALSEHYPTLGRHDFYMGRGTGGQGVWVIPGAELVVVHRGDTDTGDGVPGYVAWQIVERILAAHTGEAVEQPRLVSVHEEPLAGQRPEPEPLRIVSLDSAALAPYLGEYRVQPGDRSARVYVFDDRLFGWIQGLGDAQLYPLGDDAFAIQVVPGTFMRFTRDDGGAVTRFELDYRGRVMPGERVP